MECEGESFRIPFCFMCRNSDGEGGSPAPPPKKAAQRLESTNVSYGDDEPDLLDQFLQKHADNDVIDRLLGCAYGQALGDAYGLATEFEDRQIVAKNYPNKSEIIPFPDYIDTWHNRRWTRGDWTDDTDQWILILETLIEANGDVCVFAKKLSNWISHGFPDLGDYGGMGLGANVSQVLENHRFGRNRNRSISNRLFALTVFLRIH